jgi:hypothetical protein
MPRTGIFLYTFGVKKSYNHHSSRSGSQPGSLAGHRILSSFRTLEATVCFAANSLSSFCLSLRQCHAPYRLSPVNAIDSFPGETQHLVEAAQLQPFNPRAVVGQVMQHRHIGPDFPVEFALE